jgi:hypothetical protein
MRNSGFDRKTPLVPTIWRSAYPVRREGEPNPIDSPYPYQIRNRFEAIEVAAYEQPGL